MALVDLMGQPQDTPVSLVSVSKRQGLPLPYLEQIFSLLRKNKIVKSERGAQGGFTIARHPDEISVFDVVSSVDSLNLSMPCKGLSQGCSLQGAKCITHYLWSAIDQVMFDFLTSLTLTKIATQTALTQVKADLKLKEWNCVYSS